MCMCKDYFHKKVRFLEVYLGHPNATCCASVEFKTLKKFPYKRMIIILTKLKKPLKCSVLW